MSLRKLVMPLLAAATLVGGSMIGASGSSAAERTVPPKPQLDCPYYSVCGQAANGSSFRYTTCNFEFQLPNLVGSGPLVNNQTAGTVARFYDKNRRLLFTSTAYDSRTVNWTPVWYVRAC
ncbi:hypothetical protein OEIGOIKO_07983 [Streptomyces chrestomyceticus JCM 4735]|uniref:Secreted protein n=1 Tax=Streptomyces chrestomyceticus JCM 4735 TaxID=1306181 RepID=A0A7U9L441_9ACTN|nr:hypothetical protein [Streptomyces chrestomyceticus]GCD40126.1 hypothetical protein OEIGOIKO_07983 [Streptomyces chrestomyceticus JCM 4735]